MPLLLKIALICIVVAAGIYDLRFRKIPNWLNLSGMILGLGMNTLFFGLHGLAAAALGLICAAMVYLPLYLIRGMGAGDVKLMAAVGAIAGPQNWLGIFIATALFGGLVSLLLVVLRRRFQHTCLNLFFILSELSHLRVPSHGDARLDIHNPEALRLPHGALIATGSIAFLIFHAAT